MNRIPIHPINKTYIDKQHANIRKLLWIVFAVILFAIACISFLVVQLNRLQAAVDACK